MNARFTLDGSEALEKEIRGLTAQSLQAVQSRIPSSRLEALFLGGGYGRGEGGVLKTEQGDRPYNDLEFFVFVRGPVWLAERRYGPALHHATEELSRKAGIDVEFKIASFEKFRNGPITMFSYDLLSGHKCIFGDEHLLASCDRHRAAHRIPLYEATRLLMNRCSGLLFALDRLQRLPFTREDADFVGRNIAKAQLAFGDVMLAACGQYHWSCRERHRQLPKLMEELRDPWVTEICEEHTDGIIFKLHPHRSADSPQELAERHARLSVLGQKLWLWLENRRLGKSFRATREYAFAPEPKCPEIPALKARLVSARAFGFPGLLAHRYPRERLLRALPLLLWDPQVTRDAPAAALVQRELRSDSNDFHEWVLAYQRIWNRFN